MAYRKNVKRIDPRYFLHEKTEALNEAWQPDQMQRSYLDRAAERVQNGVPADDEAQRWATKGAFKNAAVQWQVIAQWLKEGGW